MLIYPINYDEPLFRPPSEAKSLIIQVTLGCSWNKCSFCEMYTSKRFRARKESEIFKDIDAFAPFANQIQKVFLADGDPMVLSNQKLLAILNKLNQSFPNLRRISTYASPSNLNKKTLEELRELKNLGLSLVYVGIESGDDEVLHSIQKGETYSSTIEGINKSKMAGIDASVMIINGAGGKLLSNQHALNSAWVLNATQPKYASTLVLTMHKGLEHFKKRFKGNYVEMNAQDLFLEMRVFMENLNLVETIFRSDHASNMLVLKGVLGKSKEMFLKQIDAAIKESNSQNFKNFRPIGF